MLYIYDGMIKLKDIMNEVMTKVIGYHGTNVEFDKFDLNYSAQGIIWFTSNKQKVVDNDTGGIGNKYIIMAELRMNNPANWEKYDKYGIGELKRDGYDSVILDSTENGDFDYIIFNPKQIKIKSIEMNPNYGK
jgi:hypothetical protein